MNNDFDLSQFDDIYDEDEDSLANDTPSFDVVLKTLSSSNVNIMDRAIIYGLSGLSNDDINKLEPVWQDVHAATRRKIVRTLIDYSEVDIRLDYRSTGMMCLHDADPGVREAAIELLWEDQSLELMNELIRIVKQDDNREVRAATLTALGRFILAGELEHLPQDETVAALNAALAIWENTKEDVSVRRRALEAISNSSHKIVPSAIEEGYNSPYQQMQVSAVFAMGRSYDADRWGEIVIDLLDSEDPEMLYEAARAAGELSLDDAVPKLAQITMDGDREVMIVAVEALGEIGGKTATRVLDALMEKAEEEEDDELLEVIEDAVANASLVDQLNDYEF